MNIIINFKKVFILVILTGALVSCSDKITEDFDKKINNVSQVSTEQKNISNLRTVSINTFKEEINKKDGILIDLRTDGEVAEGVIPGTNLNIDFYSSDFQNKLNALDKSKIYLIYCRSGARSGKTLKLMKKLGFANVLNLDGGIGAWERNGEKLGTLGEEKVISNESIQEKVITLNAKNWEFDKKEIIVKKGEKVKIKVNNLDGLHGIAIQDMQIVGDTEIKPDTSKEGEYEYICATYCGEGHNDMKGKLIIKT